jgi:hypothetical protein
VIPSKIATNFEENTSGELYCLILNPPLPAIVNGVECATWGHELQEDVVKNSYYSSKNIINDLKLFKGFSKGFIQIEESVTKHLVKHLKR